MKFHFSRGIVIGFFTSVLVLILLGLFSYAATQRLIRAYDLFTHDLGLISNADLALKSIVDRETGERGFIITGKDEYLGPLQNSAAPMKLYLGKLDSLTSTNAVQAKRMDTLRHLIDQKARWTNAVIALRRQSFEKARTMVDEGEGKRLTDNIRSCIARMQNQESSDFTKANTVTAQGLKQFQYSLVGLAAGLLGLILYLFYVINATLRARKDVEARLVRSSAEAEDLYNNAPCGYIATDENGNVVKINQTLLGWLGYKEEEVVGKMSFQDLLIPETREAYLQGYSQRFQHYLSHRAVYNLEFEFLRKDKTVLNVTVDSNAHFSDTGRFISARSTVSDSTDRKRAERQILELNQNLEALVDERTLRLAKSERIYKTLASNIPGSAITILDKDERYMLAEGEMLPQMGYQKETMPGKLLSEVITPENYEFYGPLIKRSLAGESFTMEKKTLSGFDMLMSVLPLKTESGDIFAVMFVYINITEIKKAQHELVDLNNNLEFKVSERTEQLKEMNHELESFSYSVSHDLRSPLRAIIGYAEMLKEDYVSGMDMEANRLNDVIILNAARMGKLIDDMLEFAKLGRKSPTKSLVDMDSIVDEVVSELTANEDPTTFVIKKTPLDSVHADPNMLRQVWVNLISNALKYSRKREKRIIVITSVRQNDEILYSIDDNGAGFDMKFADKLFGVFQRLHKLTEFEGTGVGLALIKTIIKKHGGRIWAKGEPEKGATFYFTLPLRNDG